ncbi:MAG: FAD-dependent oxidoreductase, partial [Candidatus Poseidoniia archaeon]|nr:FAD-dependent oxidoreductase [Candidatus Poseidoniia archaeon]
MSNNRIMVIGGGPAGLEAARGVVELGYELVLVEQRNELGGTPISASYAALTPDMEDTEVAMARMVNAVTNDSLADIRLDKVDGKDGIRIMEGQPTFCCRASCWRSRSQQAGGADDAG